MLLAHFYHLTFYPTLKEPAHTRTHTHTGMCLIYGSRVTYSVNSKGSKRYIADSENKRLIKCNFHTLYPSFPHFP